MLFVAIQGELILFNSFLTAASVAAADVVVIYLTLLQFNSIHQDGKS